MTTDIKNFWENHYNTPMTYDCRFGDFIYDPNHLTYTQPSKYTKAEIDSRFKFINAYLKKNPQTNITLMPLYSPYDCFVYSSFDYGAVEIKERGKKWNEVILEKLKWTEAVEGGYSEFFFYTNVFSDTGEIFSWYPKSLELTPSSLYCNRSSVESKGKKEKEVYMLGLEKRRKDLDMLID